MFPCVVTYMTVDTCVRGGNTSKRYSHQDCRGWSDCLWMCIPCSIAVDAIICVPMTGVFIGNKIKSKYQKNKVEQEKEKEKEKDNIISSPPTTLNGYEVK